MQQVADWLEKLGMSEYAQRFAENRIDFSVLPDLTDQDLEKLGVVLGDRRKMLRAIANLEALKGAPVAGAAIEVSAGPPRLDTAERRQVTLMFSDLVGSTAISAQMDPEDLREVISAYQKCVAETVQHFGGFVAKYMGDGVLVYFGYPEAHEDDAERAVRAGLELIAAVTALKSRVSLQTRVGIATGLVVVGDLIGSGSAQEQAIVGETPNLAARLQGIAEPNSVVIADGTRKLVGDLFELQDLGRQQLKGIANPVQAWTALRPSLVEGRFEALHTSGLMPLVGREEELELLLRRWSKAANGEGQVVLISGEAGIGKSRLTAALLERLASEPHTRLRNFCSPQHTDSALYPIISQLERAAGFVHDDTPHTKLNKLDTLLGRSATSAPDAALIGAMLSLPNDGRYPSLELPPPERRQRTLFALVSQVVAFSRQNPVLMISEDAHWADPTSLELLDHVVNTIPSLRVLLIVTFRSEFEPRWIGRPHVTALTLNRLAEREVGAIIDGVIGNKVLPANIRRDIIERTDGIPLFVEEMTKAVLEAGGEGAAIAAAVPSPALAIPASLHASLMARLDRLGPAKEVAQIGAAIGREFSYPLLAAVQGKPEEDLKAALDRIVAAGLLFRQGTPPHATYLFKHALVQDAAYGTLLREPRRALHVRIAETLENQFVEIAENRPEIVARHCTEAGLIEKAAALWGKAGLLSLERSALVESTEQLARALSQIETLSSTPALRQAQMKLQTMLIAPLLHIKGYGSPEAKAAVERANLLIEQAEAIGEPPEDLLLLFSVLFGYCMANAVAGNMQAYRDVATRYLELADKQQALPSLALVAGNNLIGCSHLFMGDIAESRGCLDKAIALYDPVELRPLAMRFGQDLWSGVLVMRGIALWMLGHPEAALADADRAVKDARATGQAATLMYALALADLTYMLCGNYAAGSECMRELAALSDEKGSLFWNTVALSIEARHLALTGDPAKALPKLTFARAAFRSTGANFLAPLDLSVLASTHAALGNFDDARRGIDEAVTTMETNKEKWFEVEVNRIAGEVARKSPAPHTAKAEEYFDRALAIARQQQAKSWELRAAMSMARLWRSQGKPQQARELLAPVYGWFTEGFDTLDLKEAKALLAELA
jgi:class 3 adenylate cyclase/predicted ATPase